MLYRLEAAKEFFKLHNVPFERCHCGLYLPEAHGGKGVWLAISEHRSYRYLQWKRRGIGGHHDWYPVKDLETFLTQYYPPYQLRKKESKDESTQSSTCVQAVQLSLGL